MKMRKARQQEHTKLMQIGALSRKANSFGLFRTSDSLLRIQRECVRMNSFPDGSKRTKALLREIGKAEVLLDEEHDDVALASNANGRARRGIIVSSALFILQLVNMASYFLPPEILRSITDRQENLAHIAAGCAVFALGLIPARDFLFVHRFDSIKEEVSSVLSELKKGS